MVKVITIILHYKKQNILLIVKLVLKNIYLNNAEPPLLQGLEFFEVLKFIQLVLRVEKKMFPNFFVLIFFF